MRRERMALVVVVLLSFIAFVQGDDVMPGELVETDPETGAREAAEMLKPVMYLRIYGETGVIHEGLHSLWISP